MDKNEEAVIMWKVWRQIIIPAHQGTDDLVRMTEEAGFALETWAREIILAQAIEKRAASKTFEVARVETIHLGFPRNSLVSIPTTKSSGLNRGLELLTLEEILALRLGYADQKVEWMRIAMNTKIDRDSSFLDIAIVNDGSRKDLRTTWAYPNNCYQAEHAWFWKIKNGFAKP